MNNSQMKTIRYRLLKRPFRRMVASLRRSLFAGILVTTPLAVTIYLTWLFFVFVNGLIAKLLPAENYEMLHDLMNIPGLGLLIAVVFFIVVGWFATNVLGRVIVRFSDFIFHRVPIVNTVYKAVQQVLETLIGSQAQSFREVVLLEYPRAGSWTLGFVTGPMEAEIQSAQAAEMVSVFVPTAPSPVNGFLLFVPKKDIIPLKMSVEDGIKMVVSIGIITPSGANKAAISNV